MDSIIYNTVILAKQFIIPDSRSLSSRYHYDGVLTMEPTPRTCPTTPRRSIGNLAPFALFQRAPIDQVRRGQILYGQTKRLENGDLLRQHATGSLGYYLPQLRPYLADQDAWRACGLLLGHRRRMARS